MSGVLLQRLKGKPRGTTRGMHGRRSQATPTFSDITSLKSGSGLSIIEDNGRRITSRHRWSRSQLIRMETLIEEVASQPFGAKWQQLYNRLGVEPRQRFKITVEHKQKSETERVRCCVLDTIALWRQSESVVKKSEREVMTLLLTALRKVQGFENAALRLSEKHGMCLSLLSVSHQGRQAIQQYTKGWSLLCSLYRCLRPESKFDLTYSWS